MKIITSVHLAVCAAHTSSSQKQQHSNSELAATSFLVQYLLKASRSCKNLVYSETTIVEMWGQNLTLAVSGDTQTGGFSQFDQGQTTVIPLQSRDSDMMLTIKSSYHERLL